MPKALHLIYRAAKAPLPSFGSGWAMGTASSGLRVCCLAGARYSITGVAAAFQMLLAKKHRRKHYADNRRNICSIFP